MEIISKRIDAKPRSKYIRNSYVSSYYSGGGNSGNGSTIDTSNFVWLNGRTSQLIEGNVGATGDVIAYQTTEHDITLPIASNDALGAIKIGSGLIITEDGTLNVTGSTGGGTGKAEWGYITGTLSSQTDLWAELSKKANSEDLNIENWDNASNFFVENKEEIEQAITNSHSHDNKEYLDAIDQNLSTVSDVLFNSVKATGDVVAYATGNHDISYPIASSGALGCIMVGDGLTITEDGVLSVTGSTGGGTVSEWGDITGTLSNQTDLWNELNKKANTADLSISNWNAAYNSAHTHSNLSTLNGISSTNITNWNNAYNSAHTHSNYNVLSGITSSNISNWNNAYYSGHTHSNKSVLDGISSSDVSDWNTAYNYAHNHSNKSYLDVINQSLSTSSSPSFTGATIGYLSVGSGSGRNCITNNTSPYNLYLNWFSSSNYTVVDSGNNLKTTGDVIAYSTGTASAPFKYWRPSVNSSGVLSWTNSTSETTPTSVNIKGPAGTNGTNGADGASLTYQWSGTSLRIGTTKNGSTTWGSYVNLKGADGEDGADGSSFNGGTITQGLTIDGGGAAVLALKGNVSDWQAAQIQFINEYYSDYRRKWCIESAGSSEQNGDLCFQNYNSSGSGSANASPWYRLKIYKYGTATNAVAAAGAYVNNSDSRLKNILYSYHNKPQTMAVNDTENSTESNSVLDKIKNLEAKYFYWKTPENANDEEKELPFYNTVQLGFIAQEVEAQFPEFVTEDNGYKQLNYSGLGSFIAVEASRELNQKIEEQQTEIDQLKAEIENLKLIINEIKNTTN